ncbi:MAG: hypothetical protein Q8Q59_15800 [Luteolibacter sp.]|nr:hypothetical protein [Luteolibacter sp.]
MPAIATDRPLKDAVDMLTRKAPVGSGMSSRDWDGMHAEIKLRAMFSARVESERLLSEMQSRLQVRMELAKKDGRTMDRGVFIEEMRAELTQAGYKRGDARRGSLRDLKSSRRLGLIWDMNVSQAQGFARWKKDMDPDLLKAAPAQELVRVRNKVEVRDWPLVWGDYGGEFYGTPGPDYPRAEGRMIALKTDSIWRRISRFGTPWPPFDWGSGMGLRNIRREEAIELGLIEREAPPIEPLDAPFNEATQMSVKDIPEAGRQRLLDAFAGEVELEGDVMRIIRPPAVSTVDIPQPVRGAMSKAAAVLSAWSETKLTSLLEALENTVAWKRYKAALPGEVTSTHSTQAMIRALAQFSATPEARQAMMEIRNTGMRDAFWCPADFADVERFFRAGGVL